MLFPNGPPDISKMSMAEQQELLKLLESYNDLNEAEKVRKHFLAFVRAMWPKFVEGNHFNIMAEAFETIVFGRDGRLSLSMAPRHGKLAAHDTPVLTLAGWKTHGSLVVGDHVFSPAGLPIKVMGLSAEAVADWDVTLSNGDMITVHGEHEWAVYDTRRDWKFGPRPVKTSDLAKDEWRKPRGQRGSRARWQLPDVAALQFDERSLPCDPYTLGAWLGDGTTGKDAITGAADDLRLIVEGVAEGGYAPSVQWIHNTTGVITQSFSRSGLKESLRECGVYLDKHIPELFLRAPIDQRLQLLAGLIDTDGSVEPDTGRVRIVTIKPALRDGIFDLCSTLGFRPYITSQRPAMSTSGIQGRSVVYTVGFQPSMAIPCRLKRKASIRIAKRRRVSIKSITSSTNPRPGRCIQVDSDDGLYLVGKTLQPTHNSRMSSVMLPAWFLGMYPDKKIIQASCTAELATGFGRDVRDLINSAEYQKLFPGVELKADNKAAGRWSTNKGGEYFAIGTGGSVTGRGADLLIIDDASSEQQATLAESDPSIYDATYEWYLAGPRQRLQPSGRIVIIGTRWSQRDLIGRCLADQGKGEKADQWKVIELPAILPSGNVLWPEFWTKEQMEATKATLPVHRWETQYQQNPVNSAAALIKREWWQIWKEDKPPKCESIIQSWDTALSRTERADYTACITFGIFTRTSEDTGKDIASLIMLDAWRDKLEFPALKARALREYREWEPDIMIIEGRAAGKPLIAELRAMGIPIQEFNPVRGNDKISRVNAITDIFASKNVWAPDKRWSEDVIEECLAFPAGAHDDFVDCVSQALLRYRMGGWIGTSLDEVDDNVRRKRRRAFY